MDPRSSPDQAVARRLKALKRSLPPRPVPRLKPPVPRKGSLRRRIRHRLIAFDLGLVVLGTVLPPFYWPVRAPLSSGFLLRWKPDSSVPSLEVHRGIDLAAPRGTGISASGVGFVDGVGRTADLGNFVRVTHLFGIQTLYGHLDRVDVSPGQLVIPGLGTLGLVGATGRATGPHLHFGVFWAGIPLPPEAFLVFHSLRRQLWGG